MYGNSRKAKKDGVLLFHKSDYTSVQGMASGLTVLNWTLQES